MKKINRARKTKIFRQEVLQNSELLSQESKKKSISHYLFSIQINKELTLKVKEIKRLMRNSYSF